MQQFIAMVTQTGLFQSFHLTVTSIFKYTEHFKFATNITVQSYVYLFQFVLFKIYNIHDAGLLV
jgi:hypothetical protein